MTTIMSWFKSFYNLPNVRGVINGTHFSMSKPIRPFNENYYYHRIGVYNIVCQIVIDKKKHLLIFLGLLNNGNNSQVLLKIWSLYASTIPWIV
jgi:hypothetical protein